MRLCPSDMASDILLSSLCMDKGKCNASELVAVACLSWPSSQYPSRTATSFQSCSWAIFEDATSLTTFYQHATQTGLTGRSATTTPSHHSLLCTLPWTTYPPIIAASPISRINSRSLSSPLPHYEQTIPRSIPHRIREHVPTSKAFLSVATRYN